MHILFCRHIWAELSLLIWTFLSGTFFPGGGGGGAARATPPAYAPVLCIYSLQYETPLFSIHVFRTRRLVHASSSSWLQNLNFKFGALKRGT